MRLRRASRNRYDLPLSRWFIRGKNLSKLSWMNDTILARDGAIDDRLWFNIKPVIENISSTGTEDADAVR